MAARILLVDDEPNILTPIEFLMRQQGYDVDKAFDGKHALEKMAAFLPDVVILDVMMPEMDGFEVARNIRSNAAYDQTRILFLTAKGTDADKINGYNQGGEMYIIKPFDNSELVNMVNEMVEYG
ncbi:MAG: response regulator transcription factor [Bacteroidetes bacterium]|nr:response regulator transcription factor [Bacteroidota bacterium]